MRPFTILLMSGLAASLAACDTDRRAGEEPMREEAAPQQQRTQPAERAAEREEVAGSETRELVNESAALLREMKSNAELKKVLDRAKGLFLVPDYGRAAVIVGGRGGEGVLVARTNGQWSGPVFYDIGGISTGAQFGAEGGSIAMLLMSDQAVNSFKADNTFSLNADAKLTIVDYSKLAQASLGKTDVIFWSDTAGAFAGVAVSATDVSWDDEENRSYYGQKATAGDVLSGKVKDKQGALQEALSGL